MTGIKSRPYPLDSDVWERCVRDLFPKWLKERGGIVVYENHAFDSSHFGDRSYMPARYEGEDDQMHDAPAERWPNGGLPSLRQQRVDHIRLEDFGGDVGRCVEDCFVRESPAEVREPVPRGQARERWRVLDLDVWGSADAGWEVNQMWTRGYLETGPEPESHELFEALVAEGYLLPDVLEAQLEFTGDDCAVGVDDADGGRPVFYLEYVGLVGGS